MGGTTQAIHPAATAVDGQNLPLPGGGSWCAGAQRPEEYAEAGATQGHKKYFGPEESVDGIASEWGRGPTRWNSGKTVLAEEWLEVEFSHPITWDTLRIIPGVARPQTVACQVPDGAGWRIATSITLGDERPVTTIVSPTVSTCSAGN